MIWSGRACSFGKLSAKGNADWLRGFTAGKSRNNDKLDVLPKPWVYCGFDDLLGLDTLHHVFLVCTKICYKNIPRISTSLPCA